MVVANYGICAARNRRVMARYRRFMAKQRKMIQIVVAGHNWVVAKHIKWWP